jgi:anti-sigma-K factor RskA
MRKPLLIVPFIAFAAAHAAPGFKMNVPFPAFEAWAKGASVPGVAFKETKDEAEAYVAHFKAGTDTVTVKIEGAGKFEGIASGAKTFTWKGLDAKWQGTSPALIAVKYGDSKATLSVTYTKARTQAELEKLLADLKPEKILK